jgi:orotidine-5'-phosphate decarboxylase
MVTRNPVIVALDVPNAAEAVALAESVAPYVGAFKVGLRLLHGPGPGVIAAVVGVGKPVFADAKLHDIPTQVGAAAEALGRYGARWVTAHASGGAAMLEAATEGLAKGAGGAAAGVLGVTVLTSLDDNMLRSMGLDRSAGQLVSSLARVADRAGCEGVVCSPKELQVVADVAPRLQRVTPGIRPTAGEDDQARTATPEEALGRGADWIVVGRPITAAADPAAAAAALAELIAGGEGPT